MGRLVLPEASCHDCREATHIHETRFQNLQIPGFKTRLRLSRRGNPKRSRVRIEKIHPNGTREILNPKANEVPTFLSMPRFDFPTLILGREWESPPEFVGTVLSPDSPVPAEEVAEGNFSTTIRINVTSFCLMLAKIAHSFAVAACPPEQLQKYDLLLPDLIRNGADKAPTHVVGGELKSTPPQGADLHEIAAGDATSEFGRFLSVRIRLFAPWHTPVYHVLAGKYRDPS